MASQFVAAQIVGGREKQEDDFAILDLGGHNRESLILVVADGMGGHSGAALAAKLAVAAFCDRIKTGSGALPLRLSAALHGANDAIEAAGKSDSNVRGAGCTLVAAAIENDSLSWVSVGDSGLYLYRGGVVRRLNKLHRANAHPQPARGRGAQIKVLKSSLSGCNIKEIDISLDPLKLRRGDCVLVASDGLECIGPRRMASILRRSAGRRPSEIVGRLLSAVKSKPMTAQDNTTIVFYRRRGEEGEAARTGRSRGWMALKLALVAVAAAALAFAVMHRPPW